MSLKAYCYQIREDTFPIPPKPIRYARRAMRRRQRRAAKRDPEGALKLKRRGWFW